MKKRQKGVETLKRRYGLMFVTPWMIGLALFFVIPILSSLVYMFSDVSLEIGGMDITFTGIANLKQVLNADPNYTNYLGKSVAKIAYTLPTILVMSMLLGIVMSKEFKGRFIFRALYFLPVIIASGPVLKILFTVQSGDMTSMAQEESVSANMIDISTIIAYAGLPEKIGEFMGNALSGIMNIVWNCGVLIVLFIAGMQSIPDSLYEVANVEGATKWEEFWFITFPMLSRITVLVIVFTVVELMTAQNDSVMSLAYNFMQSQKYGEASAMLWFYFMIVGLSVGIILWLYQKFCAKRWE